MATKAAYDYYLRNGRFDVAIIEAGIDEDVTFLTDIKTRHYDMVENVRCLLGRVRLDGTTESWIVDELTRIIEDE